MIRFYIGNGFLGSFPDVFSYGVGDVRLVG
jgi:hypothetical protein